MCLVNGSEQTEQIAASRRRRGIDAPLAQRRLGCRDDPDERFAQSGR